MNFLPFVLSFLLVLVVASSLIFTSFRSTAKEKMVILAQKNARLMLIGEQAKKLVKTSRKSEKPKKQGEKQKNKPRVFVDARTVRCSINESKFNLWPLLYEQNSLLANILYEKAVKLVENLYKKTEFYQAANDPDLARHIIDQMLGREVRSLVELFPKDQKLAPIYYKMVNGTNTGYPRLEEYFKIQNSGGKGGVQFRYASMPVLRAIFGDDLSNRIATAERAKWEVNHKNKILAKEELKQLIQQYGASSFDVNHLEAIFSFDQKKIDIPHAYVDEQFKIMATR